MMRSRYRRAVPGLALFLFISVLTVPGVSSAARNGPPKLTSTTPPPRATNVQPTTTIQALFNTPLDPSSLHKDSLVVTDEAGMRVPGAISYDAQAWVVRFTPAAPLQSGTRYRATLTRGIKSSDGLAMRSQKAWYFVTSSSGSPPVQPTPTSAAAPEPMIEAPSSPAPAGTPTTMTGPLVIDGLSDRTYTNIVISNPGGDCVVVRNSSRIVLDNLKVGPCNGQGIHVSASSNVTIRNSQVSTGRRATGCCDVGDGIYAARVTGLTIHNNTVQRSETNIAVLSSSDVQITGNILNNPLGPMPRGQQIMVTDQKPHPYSRDVTVSGNVLRCEAVAGCDQADAINVNSADTVLVINNDVHGGRHDTGCGIIADYEAYRTTIRNNWVANIVNCGIGIADGTNHIVEGNTLSNCMNPTNSSSNSCLYVWAQYPLPCSDIVIRNNAVYDSIPFWNGGNCQNVTIIGNSWQ